MTDMQNKPVDTKAPVVNKVVDAPVVKTEAPAVATAPSATTVKPEIK